MASIEGRAWNMHTAQGTCVSCPTDRRTPAWSQEALSSSQLRWPQTSRGAHKRLKDQPGGAKWAGLGLAPETWGEAPQALAKGPRRPHREPRPARLAPQAWLPGERPAPGQPSRWAPATRPPGQVGLRGPLRHTPAPQHRRAGSSAAPVPRSEPTPQAVSGAFTDTDLVP